MNQRLRGAALVVVALTLAGCSASPVTPAPPSGGTVPSGGAVPNGGGLAAGAIPEPGQVGFLGDPSTLQVIDAEHAGPQGTEFRGGVLHITGSDVVLDKVLVLGGIDKAQPGTLTIRNSIVEGTDKSWSPLFVRAGHLDISDSTVRWKAGEPAPGPRWGNGAINGAATMVVRRCDISGTPDGIQNGSGDSTIEQNYIHGLALLGVPPDNTHNDGIQSFGGPGLVIRNNRIDIRDPSGMAYDGTHQNGAVFVQPGAKFPSDGLQVIGNVLVGGGYTLRLEAPTTGATVTDNRFGPTSGAFGSVLVDKSGVGITRWSDNRNDSGADMVSPVGPS